MTDEVEIKVGDVVNLKSGSQKMVVEEIENGSAKTVWSEYGAQLIHHETFKLTSLKIVGVAK